VEYVGGVDINTAALLVQGPRRVRDVLVNRQVALNAIRGDESSMMDEPTWNASMSTTVPVDAT
jgi:hypothetical protein